MQSAINALPFVDPALHTSALSPEQLFNQVFPQFRKFTISVAYHYGRFYDEHHRKDLEQCGYIALWKACQKFNPAIETPFEHYARRAISNGIKTAVKKLVAEPINSEYLEHDQDNNQDDSVTPTTGSYFDPVFNKVSNCQALEAISSAQAALSSKQQMLFERIYIEGMSGTAVARELGVTQQAISKQFKQIELLVKDAVAEYIN